jgi:hypothetical protein
LRLGLSSLTRLRRRSRLASRRFDSWRWRGLGPRNRDRLRGLRRGRRRRKLDRSGRGRRCLRRRRRLLLYRRRRLLSDRRRRRFRGRKRGLLDDRRRRSFRRGQWRLGVHGRRRRLLGDWRRNRGWRRRLGRSRGAVLSWWRRGLVGLRLFGRGCRRFRGRSLRLDVDDHFAGQYDRPGLQIDERKRRGVERDDDGDDEGAEPGRAERRRLEVPTVQGRKGHGACA